ncbi:MAG: ABC transporter permease [Chloroflexi bacterium]|nr:ABC transporter permease [Chloroflexota bacterium]
MRDYIIRRILLLIPTLLLVTIIVFMLVRFIPGSVLDLMVSEMAQMTGDTDLDIGALRAMLGLDVPVYVQYFRWLGVFPQAEGGFAGVIQGNLGYSLWSHEPVRDMIFARFPVTFELGFLALLIAWSIALPVAILSAIRQDSILDYGTRSATIFFVAAPGFWLATMIVVYPSIWWSWTPPMEYIQLVKNPLGNLGQFLIPAFVMGAAMSATTARYGRTLMLEVLRQDYIRTVWAKGLRERTILTRHALRNALIPLITMLGIEVPFVLGGSVVMEQIFVLPGVGRLFFQALTQRDYPVISGVNVMVATIVMIVNLLVDISYAYLDPRIRYK